jgi:two-component system nitrate/nitrite response regulator NarL
MSDVRVIVVADDLIVRAGLAALLSDQAGVRVVGQSAPAKALEDAELLEPDAIVWDLGWEQEVPSALLSMEWPLLLLVGVSERRALPAVDAGAFALLPRDSSPRALVLALHTLMQGLIVVAPPLLPRLNTSRSAPNEPVEALTNREREVLALLAQGCTNKAIALQLNITEHTVKFHVNAIMSKLGAQSRTDAVIRATRAGLISL